MADTIFFAALGAGFCAVVTACALLALWQYVRSGEYEREPWVNVYFEEAKA